MKKDNQLPNSHIHSVCRLKADIKDHHLRNLITASAVKENNVLISWLDVTGIESEETEKETPLSLADEFRQALNSQFISDVKLLIHKGLILSDNPLAIRIADVLGNETGNSVITNETKEIARSLIQAHREILSEEKKTRNSDSNIRVKALEIVNAMFDGTNPEHIADERVFYSAVEKTVQRAKGKKIQNSYIGKLVDARPETISEEEVRNLVSSLSHTDRASTKRKIEKNKRSHYLESAIVKHFHKVHSCERDPKLRKSYGVRVKTKQDKSVRYVAIFCRNCRTSVHYPVTFNKKRPETLASRVKRIFGSSLAAFKRSDSVANRMSLSAVEKQYKADMDIWYSEKATWKKEQEIFISNMMGVRNTPEGAGISSRISDRKNRNRIRTR